MTGLRPQLESKFSDVHQSPGAKLENNLQNCSGASRVSSSQYNTCSALHRRSQGVQLKNPEQTPLTHRVGQLDTIDSEKETPDPCAQALLLTGAPGCPTESATGSCQCNSLQCSLVHGSGRLNPTPLTEQDRRARGARQQDSQDKTKEQTNSGTNQPPTDTRGEGGSHGGGCVCV